MAGIVLNIIAIASGTPSLVSFFSNLLAARDAQATVVRVVLGSNANESESLSGNRPGASLWDFNGNAIGKTDGSSEIIPQGNFVDIKVTPRHGVGNIQAEYVSITNGGDDAICIAGIALSFLDGSKAGFSTDVAAACGAFWSNSNTPVVDTAATGFNNPKCVWIDRDGSNGIPHQGMGIHLPSFSDVNKNLGTAYKNNTDLMCKSGPRFRMYPQLTTEDSILVFQHPLEFITTSDDPALIGTDQDPGFIIENPGILAAPLVDPPLHSTNQAPGSIIGNPSLPAGHHRKRSAGSGHRRRYITQYDDQHASAASNITMGLNSTASPPVSSRRPMAERVIISPNTYNSARELCESYNSFGHSFVSIHESLFCDMTDKSLYYMCSDKINTCCFDADAATFRGCERSSRRPPVDKVNGTSIYPTMLRSRQATNESTLSWMKGDKIYDSVQRW